MDKQRLRDVLGATVTDAPTPLAAVDRLCAARVDLRDVDGASVSFIDGGTMQGTFGSSGQLSRTLDELQFTYGRGPCLPQRLPTHRDGGGRRPATGGGVRGAAAGAGGDR